MFKFSILLIITLFCGLQSEIIRDTISDTTTYIYGDIIYSSNIENIEMIICVDDTTSSGFGDDSINFQYGIQLIKILTNTSNIVDTLHGLYVVVDTITPTSFGNVTEINLTELDGITHKSHIDTLSISGYACQHTFIINNAIKSTYMRPFIRGLGSLQKRGCYTLIKIFMDGQ